MYIYEGHMGGFYSSDEPKDNNELYCEECGNSDWLYGYFEEDLSGLLKFIRYMSFDDYDLSYITETVNSLFGTHLTETQIKNYLQKEV